MFFLWVLGLSFCGLGADSLYGHRVLGDDRRRTATERHVRLQLCFLVSTLRTFGRFNKYVQISRNWSCEEDGQELVFHGKSPNYLKTHHTMHPPHHHPVNLISSCFGQPGGRKLSYICPHRLQGLGSLQDFPGGRVALSRLHLLQLFAITKGG